MQSLQSLLIAAIGLVTLAGCAHQYSANRAAPPPPVYTSTTQPGLLPRARQWLCARTRPSMRRVHREDKLIRPM